MSTAIAIGLIVAGGLIPFIPKLGQLRRGTENGRTSGISRARAFEYLDALQLFFQDNPEGREAIVKAGKALFEDTK